MLWTHDDHADHRAMADDDDFEGHDRPQHHVGRRAIDLEIRHSKGAHAARAPFGRLPSHCGIRL